MEIWAKSKSHPEGKYLVVRRDGTIPEWPHFVLGGFDPCAQAALEAYAETAEDLGYDAAYVSSIRELAADFRALSQTTRALTVANPSAGPHRQDMPAIVNLMGGRIDDTWVRLQREKAGERPDE